MLSGRPKKSPIFYCHSIAKKKKKKKKKTQKLSFYGMRDGDVDNGCKWWCVCSTIAELLYFFGHLYKTIYYTVDSQR